MVYAAPTTPGLLLGLHNTKEDHPQPTWTTSTTEVGNSSGSCGKVKDFCRQISSSLARYNFFEPPVSSVFIEHRVKIKRHKI